MTDEPRWDDIFSSQPGSAQPGSAQPSGAQPSGAQPDGTPQSAAATRSRREPRESEGARRRTDSGVRHDRDGRSGPKPPRRKRRRWLAWLISILVLLGLAAGAAWYVWTNYENQVREVMGWELPIDYVGEGTGTVIITITNGQLGSDVAETLHKSGVTMTVKAFYELLLTKPEVQFNPGSYSLKKQMSAQAALDALLDPANHVQTRAVIPEGTTVNGVISRLADLSESTQVTLEQLQVAAADYLSYGLPAEAPSLEGFLFPATYSLDPGMTAHDILQTMVTEMISRLDAAGVAPGDRLRVLTIASLIQKEAGSNPDDFYKVSRVIQNRLDSGTKLQFDSTSHYGYVWKHGGREEGGVFSTSAELSDDNPFNTYVISGLPIGPIAAAGELAIDAALHPADGPWMFFVTVNLDTGETVFSETNRQHEAAVNQLRKWCRDSQSPNCD